MGQTMDRRTFMFRSARAAAGLAVLGSAATALAACGDDDEAPSTPASGGKNFGVLNYQLSWIKNVEFAGAVHRRRQGLLQGRPVSARST